jgi:hypothetical protein
MISNVFICCLILLLVESCSRTCVLRRDLGEEGFDYNEDG